MLFLYVFVRKTYATLVVVAVVVAVGSVVVILIVLVNAIVLVNIIVEHASEAYLLMSVR